MTRATIDYGIDLGTTNSAIALLRGTEVEVFRNDEGFEYTPSAIWMDKSEQLIVGRPAKERLQRDPENAHSEFKLQMGTPTEYTFGRNGRRMKPEELSAEVLTSLKKVARKRAGEEVQATVITVPAAFELPQCRATDEAAKLAGFTVSPLLQEPVAAAMAYGFQSESDKVFWLVYDLGGGTFDAAVIQVRDGLIEVIAHGGDNHLGGTLLDWAIVNEILIPEVTREHPLTDFRPGNPKWAGAMAKLKQQAETAKIRVSNDESALIEIEYLCDDERNDRVELEYTLTRAEVERLAEPFLRRSVNITRKVLAEKRLAPGDVDRVILVGGPTLMPSLRERLADPGEGLGIPLEVGVDPLTVVARGAAIFAGTQRLDVGKVARETLPAGRFAVELDYPSVGSDPEPPVGGKVVPPEGVDLAGYTVELIKTSAQPPWRSGKLSLTPEGTFMTQVWAEKPPPPNTFRIELCDPAGNPVEVTPETFTYTLGMTVAEQPLIHSVGVAMVSNEVDWFFRKGAALPLRKRSDHKTVFAVSPGEEGMILRIPVVEGERERADRNRLIGHLEIPARSVRREVPAGSDVEILVEIDESRRVRTSAFIPILNDDFEEVHRLEMSEPDPDELAEKVEEEMARLDAVRQKAASTDDSAAARALEVIDEEHMVPEVESSLSASRGQRDRASECQARLLDLRNAIDEVEDALEWPALAAEAETELTRMNDVMSEFGNPGDKERAQSLERETRRALEDARRDTDLLRRKVAEINGHTLSVLQEQPGFWVSLLHQLEDMKGQMRDPAQAEQYFTQGLRAINNNDVAGLRSAVQQLIALLPVEQQGDMAYGAGTLKA